MAGNEKYHTDANGNQKPYISQIQLPSGTGEQTITYDIHDAEAIHSLDDLGLSTPLNFKGIVEYESDLTAAWSVAYPESRKYSSDTELLLTWDNFDLHTQHSTPQRIVLIASTNAGDKKKVFEFVIDPSEVDGKETWRSAMFSDVLLLGDGARYYELYWNTSDKAISIVQYDTTTVQTLHTSNPNDYISLSLAYQGNLKSAVAGDVYLVRSTGQEYVYLIEEGAAAGRWEPLGNVHDAASSTHIHTVSVGVKGKNSSSNVTCDPITIPTYTAESYKTNPFSVGSAASWEAKVQNGILSFTWTANTPSSFDYKGLVKAVTLGSTSREITGTAAAQEWNDDGITVTVSGPEEPNTNPTT